ncbi:MAG TPA: carboxylating nicotinate-nucleotide diphosphorylase [Candidatus Baltobacteraceae bacterium]|jgi:nicotinate-nucleotide pyrophosphorylase (carboxylating)|nr:carboxylating nicotinate-nucleotide diphosphorylase [Candidatus Baltobacteraceae bacterium]
MKRSPNVRLHASAASLELVAEQIVRSALLEDVGRGGDLTTDAIVGAQRRARARIIARKTGVVAGMPAAALAFRLLDHDVEIAIETEDGASVETGGVVAEISGSARAILTGERTALNMLSRLSGIATATRAMVDAVAGSNARIVGTRKTTPGLRALERYAVGCGGGFQHRFGLDDGVLIKDNHLALAGSIHAAVGAVRLRLGHMVKVEVEVDTIAQLREALAEPIDAVLLDNMTPPQLAEAVALVGGRVLAEASGAVNPQNVAAIAATGVDLISSGWLTHSAPALDLGLDIAL